LSVFSGKDQAASPQAKGRSEAPIAEAAAEIRRLQREVEYLRRQREILKKAMSILSEDPQSGMR
jgi:transposase-like protein